MKIDKILQPVMIKGFRGEPETLNSIEQNKFSVTVVGKSGNTQMELKIKYVYLYDKELYQKLKEAFNSKDAERLAEEWKKAQPINLT